MSTYVLIIIAAVLIAAVVLIAWESITSKTPAPESGDVALDYNRGEWILLRALNNGSFMFRSPQGKIKSQTLKQIEANGFLNQFDFKAIQKN